MKVHLLKPDVNVTLCGLRQGQYTTNPDVADCKRCLRLREYHDWFNPNLMKWPV